VDVPETVARTREICLSLPEVTERMSHGAPTWFVRGKTSFVTIRPEGHHDDLIPHLLSAAPPGAQEALIATEPERYFRPPYVGVRGWVGTRLVPPVTEDDLRELCTEAYRAVAPKTLIARLDAAEA
jgi:hypothetical protein